MYAKVKESYRWPSLRACAGVVFNKKTFVRIPPDREEEAMRNSHLEIVDELPAEEKALIVEGQAQKQAPKQATKQAEQKHEEQEGEKYGLSDRIWAALEKSGLPNVEAVKGFVMAKGPEALQDIDGIGKSSSRKIVEALEMPQEATGTPESEEPEE